MKRSMFGLVMMALGVAGLHAQSSELKRVFDDANRLYLEQKYDSAIVRYESIVRNGYESGELYHNIGNAYYKAGKFQYAILNYERAKRIIPDDEDLQFNLQLANLHITDKVEAVPELFIERWFNRVLTLVPPSSMVWVLYGIFLLMLGAFSYFITSGRAMPRRYSLVVGIAAAVVLLLGTATLVIQSVHAEESVYAIVTADVANIKAAPDGTGNDLFIIHSGLKVQILDDVNNWRKIRLADGKIGWIQKNDIENI